MSGEVLYKIGLNVEINCCKNSIERRPAMNNHIEIIMPKEDEKTRIAREECACFIARMIEKYGDEVLKEIREEEAEKTRSKD